MNDTPPTGAEAMRATNAAEVAALLVDLHEHTGRSIHLRRTLRSAWKAAYPEDRADRAGRARRSGAGDQPGTVAAQRIRQGLVWLEQRHLVARRGEDHVEVLDLAGLARIAEED